ncbi:hypothetical protein BC830DRAFT_1107213 [Chytriomyces sp. MP71]|nr:hypothetical protein BC830DRAFT_1107213 [Chytriomyces sp. MP71]
MLRQTLPRWARCKLRVPVVLQGELTCARAYEVRGVLQRGFFHGKIVGLIGLTCVLRLEGGWWIWSFLFKK